MSSRRLLVALASATAVLAFGGLADAEVVQKAGIRVNFEGELAPKALPRTGQAPVRVSVGAKIAPPAAAKPPRLKRISIAINSAGRFSPSTLPLCTMRDIQPATTENALAACGSSLVGTGTFAAKVLLPQQASFPAGGKLYAFNGRYRGRPAILAHVYGTDPVPTSFTLPFTLTTGKGELGTVLTASLAGAAGEAGYITELSLDLGKTTGSAKGAYISAACPAPRGFGGGVFTFAKATFDFVGSQLTATLIRNCKVRR